MDMIVSCRITYYCSTKFVKLLNHLFSSQTQIDEEFTEVTSNVRNKNLNKWYEARMLKPGRTDSYMSVYIYLLAKVWSFRLSVNGMVCCYCFCPPVVAAISFDQANPLFMVQMANRCGFTSAMQVLESAEY